MKDCRRIRKALVDVLSGEPGRAEQDLVESHLKKCPECRAEAVELRQVFRGAEAVRADIESVMAHIDWEDLPRQISQAVFKQDTEAAAETPTRRLWSFIPRLKPVYVGLLLGIFLGSLATFIVFRTALRQPEPGQVFFASRDFLENVELEIARRETLDYLEKSQYLLLDFVQASPAREAADWQSTFASEKARDLLTKKKYINQQLDKFQMAKAKEICNQIELLFLELAQVSERLSPEQVRDIQKFIEEKQLLLKIKLLKKELEQSEV